MRIGRYLRLLLAGVGATLVLLGLAPAAASSANISHSYQAATSIKNGSIVSLDPSRSGYVQPADTGNGSKLIGVVVVDDDSLIAVHAGQGKVQVATTGTAPVLVSTLNGNINVGDQIGVSPFSGIGMKALPGSKVIGLAHTSFNADAPGAATQQVTDKAGKTTSIEVGYAQADIAITTNATVLANNDLNTLQRFAKSITGHTVSTQRVVISLAVAVVAMLALITLVYASIYSSIVSIGRNPLAKYAVFRTLGSVLALAFLTTVISGLVIFFLLK